MKKTILLADDSVTIQKVIELTFMDGDFEVVAVSSGTEAIERMEEVSPDLVIADVHMPGASGYEVCRAAKGYRDGIPVLLLVGMFEPYDDAEATQSGAEAHLKKPFDSQELLDLVGRLWQESHHGGIGDDTAVEPHAPAMEATAEEAAETTGSLDGTVEGTFDGDATSAFDASDLQVGGEAGAPAPEEPPAPVWGNLEIDAADDAGDDEEAATHGAPPADPDQPFGDIMAPVVEPASAGGEGQPFGRVASAAAAAASTADDAASDVDADDEVDEVAVQTATDGPAPSLSEQDVDRIARRVVELLGDQPVREVAWEVIPDMAEVVIKERIRELEAQVES